MRVTREAMGMPVTIDVRDQGVGPPAFADAFA